MAKEKHADKDKKPRINILKDGRAKVRVAAGTAAVLADPESIKDWDDEELLRGQRKDKNGRFTGRPPRIVPSECHKELAKRSLDFAKNQLAYDLRSALVTLTKIMTDPRMDERARIKAAGMIMDRVLGKPKETIAIEGGDDEPKWLQTLNVAIVSEPAKPQSVKVEAQVIDSPKRKRKET